jgi:hypothetical protein
VPFVTSHIRVLPARVHSVRGPRRATYYGRTDRAYLLTLLERL